MSHTNGKKTCREGWKELHIGVFESKDEVVSNVE